MKTENESNKDKDKDFDVAYVEKQLHDIFYENGESKKVKFLNEDQVKTIWDFALSSIQDLDMRYREKEESENGSNFTPDLGLDLYNENKQEYDRDDIYNLDGNHAFDADEQETESVSKNAGEMEWSHMYPVRKSIYNRKSHFLSFIQNYTRSHLGRKLMSEYEQTMCDFILKNMKPTSSEEFLDMLKGCKLSNVYRYYQHIYNDAKNQQRSNSNNSEIDIEYKDIDRIYHIFSSFQSFFHRQRKFKRKNFLSMRFVLGKILLFLNIVKSKEDLPVDLHRPKGKVQLEFHEQVWQMFLDSMQV